MFDAQIMIAPTIAADEAFTLFSPWMARGGDNAGFALEVLAETLRTSPAGTFIVEVYTKENDDAGEGAPTTASLTYTAGTSTPGILKFDSKATDAAPMKDMVRFRFLISDDALKDDWIMFRMLPPTWFDSVASPSTP